MQSGPEQGGSTAGLESTGGALEPGFAGSGGTPSGLDAPGGPAGRDAGVEQNPSPRVDAGAADEAGPTAPAPPSDAGLDIPGFDDLLMHSNSMAEFNGQVVFAYFDHNVNQESLSETLNTRVVDGGFSLRWHQQWDRNTFGAYGYLYVDQNESASCDGNEPAWSFFINHLGPNNAAETLEFTTDPEEMTQLRSIDCEAFVQGLR